MENKILSETSSYWLTFLITLGLVSFLVTLGSKFIEKTLKSLGINFANRFAGAILGSVKLLLIIYIPIYFLFKLNLLSKASQTSEAVSIMKIFISWA